jgi:DNA-binding transcriptional regulator YhcF (GntR family)
MGSAIWLFAYFILCADRQTGSLKRKTDTISRHMGVKTRTVRAWLRVLRQCGYIETINGGRSLLIKIKKWKTHPQRHPYVQQTDTAMPGRLTEPCQAGEIKKSGNQANSSQISIMAGNSNDITLKKDILNDNVGDLSRLVMNERVLAMEICQAFKDEKNLPLYLSYVNQYPIEIIKKAYQESIKLPSNKIKKTRGALFTYLVKHYAAKKYYTQNHGH